MSLDPWLAGAAWLGCALLLGSRLRRRRGAQAGRGTCASCPASSPVGRPGPPRSRVAGPPQ